MSAGHLLELGIRDGILSSLAPKQPFQLLKTQHHRWSNVSGFDPTTHMVIPVRVNILPRTMGHLTPAKIGPRPVLHTGSKLTVHVMEAKSKRWNDIAPEHGLCAAHPTYLKSSDQWVEDRTDKLLASREGSRCRRCLETEMSGINLWCSYPLQREA